MEHYLRGAASQLMERGRILTAKIPRNLPRDYDTLAQSCRQKINHQIEQLRFLLDDPVFEKPTYQAERLRLFKRVVAEMDIIETVGIAALDRAKDDDHRLNCLLERICGEIRYPLVTPVVTTLSQQYFHIFTDLNLLCVPLTEGQFLLHLPDLYHELAHPLLTEQNDPVIEPFQKEFLCALQDVLAYIDSEQAKEGRRRGPSQPRYLLRIWEASWVKYWMIEFFCDLFAAHMLGPAFAWSHLHLAAKRGIDPFEVPCIRSTSHPADDARMRVILHSLSLSGFEEPVGRIRARWEAFLSQSQVRPEPEYHRCYPDDVLKKIAKRAFESVPSMNVRMAKIDTQDPIHRLLNDAWDTFWISPDAYVEWEKHAVRTLFEQKGASAAGPEPL